MSNSKELKKPRTQTREIIDGDLDCFSCTGITYLTKEMRNAGKPSICVG